MITRLKIVFTVLAMSLGLLFTAAAGADYNPLCPTQDSKGSCTSGACQDNGSGATDPSNPANSPACKQAVDQGTDNPISGPKGIINKAANIIAIVTGIGAVIMILIGGFEFITAGGTGFKAAAGAAPTKAAKARARISSALIGLVVIALAWVLVRLITDRVIK